MKKILFVSSSLGLGGSERCMAEMIRGMDLNKYNITLLALMGTENEHNFDERIRIINGYHSFERMNMPFSVFCKEAISQRNFCQLWHKLRYRVRTQRNRHHLSQDFWQELSVYVDPFEEVYDAVIGYGQGPASYFAIDKVPNAAKKILWLNTDLEKARYNISFVRRFYEKADAVFTDSQNGVRNVNRLFPGQQNVYFFHNMMDIDGILEKGTAYEPEYKHNGAWRLFSVGRLCEAKAFHLAISAASILKQRQVDFNWYIVGDGSLRKALEEQIIQLNLQDNVILLGKRENPYPWFAQCDLYVQTSIYEGSCMTLNEAMLFNKPVVTTNFPAAYEKIRDGQNGLICEMKPEDIASKIVLLLTDEDQYRRIARELEAHPLSYGENMVLLESILDN